MKREYRLYCNPDDKDDNIDPIEYDEDGNPIETNPPEGKDRPDKPC